MSSSASWTTWGSLNVVSCTTIPSYIISANHIAALEGAANASMSCWVIRFGANGTFGSTTGFGGYGGSSSYNFEYTSWSSGLGAFISNGSQQFSSCGNTLSGWHNIIVTYAAGVVVIYVDGVAQTLSGGSYPATLPESANAGPVIVGDDFQNDIGGMFTDFQIWNVTLTASQAASVYAKGAQQ
jgi:hypothetical protein